MNKYPDSAKEMGFELSEFIVQKFIDSLLNESSIRFNCHIGMPNIEKFNASADVDVAGYGVLVITAK